MEDTPVQICGEGLQVQLSRGPQAEGTAPKAAKPEQLSDLRSGHRGHFNPLCSANSSFIKCLSSLSNFSQFASHGATKEHSDQ